MALLHTYDRKYFAYVFHILCTIYFFIFRRTSSVSREIKLSEIMGIHFGSLKQLNDRLHSTKIYSILTRNPRSINKSVNHLPVLKPSCQLLGSTFQWVSPSSQYLPVKVNIFMYHWTIYMLSILFKQHVES